MTVDPEEYGILKPCVVFRLPKEINLPKKKPEIDIFHEKEGLLKSGQKWYYLDRDGSIAEIEYEPKPDNIPIPEDQFKTENIEWTE